MAEQEMTRLERVAIRGVADEQYFERLLLMRRIIGRANADLEAIEAIGAAATALEHAHPQGDAALARKLRLAANLLLKAVRHEGELIRQVHELDGTYDRIDREVEAEEVPHD